MKHKGCGVPEKDESPAFEARNHTTQFLRRKEVAEKVLSAEGVMPWNSRDVSKHNRSVKSPKRKKQWKDVANSILSRTGDEGRAIRGANSAVAKSKRRRSSRP